MLGRTHFDFTALVRGEAILRKGEQFNYTLGTLDYERWTGHRGYYLASSLQDYWPEALLRTATPNEIEQRLRAACPQGTSLTVDSKVTYRKHAISLSEWYTGYCYTYTLHCTEAKSRSEYEQQLELEKRIWKPKPLSKRIEVDESFQRMRFLTKEAEEYCEYLLSNRIDLMKQILNDVISRSIIYINDSEGIISHFPEAIYAYNEIGYRGGICENRDWFDYHDKIAKPYWVANDMPCIVTWREYGMKPPKSLTGFLLAFARLFIERYEDKSVVLKWDNFRGDVHPMMFISSDINDETNMNDALEDF